MKKGNKTNYVLTIGIVLIALVLSVVSSPVTAESTNILPEDVSIDGRDYFGYFQINCNVDSAAITFNYNEWNYTSYVENGDLRFRTIAGLPIKSITVTANGYQSQTITNITPPSQQQTVFYNITLIPKSPSSPCPVLGIIGGILFGCITLILNARKRKYQTQERK